MGRISSNQANSHRQVHRGQVVVAILGLGALALTGCKAATNQGQAVSPSGSPAASGVPGASGQAGAQASGGQGRQGGFGGQAGPAGARGRNAVISVQIATATAGALKADHQTAGTIQPTTTSNVSAQTSGVVARLVHKVGDWVNEGDTVIKLDDTQLTLTARNAQAVLENARINLATAKDTTEQALPRLKLQVDSAQKAYESAQKSYASAQALFDAGGITGSELDNAGMTLANAQANLESAKTNLSLNGRSGSSNLDQLRIAVDQASIQVQQAQLNLAFTKVKAPFAGQIAAITVAPGQFIGTSTAAFTLVSSLRQINFNATPVEASRLSQGSALYFIYNGQAYPARLSQAPSAPINGVVPMVAQLNGKANLPFGTVGTVSFSLALTQGIIIPVAALQANEKQYFVYTVQNGKAVQQTITILDQSGSDVAVSGLAANAQIILNAPPGLLPGSTVQAFGDTISPEVGAAPSDAAGQRRQRPAATGQADGNGAPAVGEPTGNQGAGQAGTGQRRPRPAATATPTAEGASSQAGQ